MLEACSDPDCDNTKFVKLLIRHGADASALDNNNNSILHLIAKNKNFNFVKYVIELAVCRGININARNTRGFSAIDVNEITCENLLEFMKNGVDLNITFNNYLLADHKCHVNWFECPSLEYVRRLKHLGCNMRCLDFHSGKNENDLSVFYDQELGTIRKHVIAWNPRRTLFDVLLMTRSFMMRYCGNKSLREMLYKYDGDFGTKYPYFGRVLSMQCHRGRRRKDLTESTKRNLDKVFGGSVIDVCSDIIFKYLADCQLQKFANEEFN